MEVCFYSRTKKPFGKEIQHNWVEIFFGYDDDEEEDQNTFYENGREGNVAVGEVPIFYGELYEEDGWQKYEVLSKITKLCHEKNCEVVILCETDFFRKAVKRTQKNEMEANFLVTENREILYYATVGAEKCALLVAYDSISDWD